MSAHPVAAAASAETAVPPVPTALRDVTPLALAVIPFSLAIGATIAASDVSAPVALAGSVLLMAGSSQLAAIGQVDAGSSAVVAIGMALMINSRLVLYSAGLAEWFEGLPRLRRLLLAVPIVDQTFLLGQRRFTSDTSLAWRQRYYIGATGLLFTCFVVAQVVGYHVGSSLPPGLGLHLAAPLAFVGLLAMACDGRAGTTAALAAGVVLLAAAGLPGGLAVPAAAVAGLVAGSLASPAEASS